MLVKKGSKGGGDEMDDCCSCDGEVNQHIYRDRSETENPGSKRVLRTI